MLNRNNVKRYSTEALKRAVEKKYYRVGSEKESIVVDELYSRTKPDK